MMLIGFMLPCLCEAYGFRKCAQYEYNLSHVICIRKNIVNLIKAIEDLPRSTTHLNLTQNEIKQLLPASFVNLSALVDLRIQWNKISNISEGTFSGLGNLSLLNLVENHITRLNSSIFKGLVNLQTLLLNHNKITHIDKSAFEPLVNLQYLDMSRNFMKNFSNVIESVKCLRQLLVLKLANNSISSINLSPQTIDSLQTLSLQGNHLTRLDFTNLSLPNLTVLDVSRNKIKDINSSTFQNLLNLISLNLSGNSLRISHLQGKYLQNLTVLDVSNVTQIKGQLDKLCTFFLSLPNLKYLIMKKNHIIPVNIEQIANCTQLLSFDLSENSLTELTGNEFDLMTSLNNLTLKSCDLLVISNSTWKTLKNLTSLDVSTNKIRSLASYTLTPLKKLQYLDLSQNPLTEINNLSFFGLHDLKHLKLIGCWITAVDKYSFAQLPNLEELNLSGNNIRKLKRRSFYFVTNLKVLTLSLNRISTVYRDAFVGLGRLQKLDLAFNILFTLSDTMFYGLQALESLYLSYNKISYESTKKLRIPPFYHLRSLKYLNLEGQFHGLQVIPINFFQGLHNLQELQLGKNEMVFLDHLQLDPLVNLNVLDISGTRAGNRGLYLNASLFRKLTQLQTLRLESNYMDTFPVDLFSSLESLQIFSLRFNNIKNISKDFLKNLKSLKFFDMYGNKLTCSCDNAWFKNWSVSNPAVQVPFLGSYHCSGQGSNAWFVDFDESLCNVGIEKTCFIWSFSLVLFTIVSSLVYAKLTWFLRYSCYIFKSWFLSKWKRTEMEYTYDAFVSFTSSDENWVYQELVPALEQNGPPNFKLCLHHRDFELGLDIFENIQSSINNSRKTLCIISNDYLRSEWCRMEVQLASLRLFYNNHDAVILIFLEAIPDYRLSAYQKLRKLVKKQTFISWPEDPNEKQLFWARVRNAIAQKTVNEPNLKLNIAE
uniref:TIR domain-containing protein n=2 Tax=Latimeria chalumnae TaxID=7897 RepID=H3AY93_LATCH